MSFIGAKAEKPSQDGFFRVVFFLGGACVAVPMEAFLAVRGFFCHSGGGRTIGASVQADVFFAVPVEAFLAVPMQADAQRNGLYGRASEHVPTSGSLQVGPYR